MVWNTTQSALYKAIDAFNNGEITGTDQACAYNKNIGGENCSEMHTRNRPDIHEKNQCCDRRSPQRCTQAPPESKQDEQQCPCRNCPAAQTTSDAPLSKLFSDNDMLLIAGLILILSRQNADRKLLLALAFVLLT